MSNIRQINNRLFINDEEVEYPKSLFFSNTVCQVNNKAYVNGKEFKKGEWKYTLKSLFYTIF